jgi:hypothetical protein
METSPLPHRIRVEWVVALTILVAYICWILSLPSFPSFDGPVHMYYVHVLKALIGDSNPEYAYYFRIRHILPPYSLYYYGLLALSQIMPMLLADRIIICIYLVSFVFGFRYLASAIGPSADLMTLLATLLLLNWPLGMGFVNFCLSLSIAFWAIGLWLRVAGTPKRGARIGFLVLATMTMLTHPVPLILLLVVSGTISIMRFVHKPGGEKERHVPSNLIADVLTLSLASLNVVYVKLFTNANPFQQVVLPGDEVTPYWTDALHRMGIYGREHALAFVLGTTPDILVYRAALLTILVLAIIMGIRQRHRNKVAGLWTNGDSFLALGAVIAVALPFIPSQLNGLYYFADRLVICVWLAFLLAASGCSASFGDNVLQPPLGERVNHNRMNLKGHLSVPRRAATLVPVICTILANVALLSSANRMLRPAAKKISALDNVTLAPRGQVGFLLEDPREGQGNTHETLSWNPYHWALIHLFRNNDAVMANAPWMDESIIPIAPSKTLPEVSILPLREPLLIRLQKDLLQSPVDLNRALGAATFFAVNDFGLPRLQGNEPLLQRDRSRGDGWSCSVLEWYRICRRPIVAKLADGNKALSSTVPR